MFLSGHRTFVAFISCTSFSHELYNSVISTLRSSPSLKMMVNLSFIHCCLCPSKRETSTVKTNNKPWTFFILIQTTSTKFQQLILSYFTRVLYVCSKKEEVWIDGILWVWCLIFQMYLVFFLMDWSFETDFQNQLSPLQQKHGIPPERAIRPQGVLPTLLPA